MKLELKYPYKEYDGYLVVNSENRNNVCLVHKETKQRTTISYARYLMSVKECRILSKDEHIDHIDGDKTNDVIENLQILTQLENNRKRLIETDNTRKMVKLLCPSCNKSFSIKLNKSHFQQSNTHSTCSINCHIALNKRKLSKDELKQIGINQVLEHFRE